jgi:putative effector of murein hydrolase LrgA (UPF0299 family)
LDVIKGNFFSIITIVLVSTIVVMAVTGITIQVLKGDK